jgi:exodeoxyribonuclease VII small subunit
MMADPEQANGTHVEARFEDVLARLGSVVEKLETGDLPLEDSLSLFEEGVRLSRIGTARLDEAERRVERLLRGDSIEVAGSPAEPPRAEASVSLEPRYKENEAP